MAIIGYDDIQLASYVQPSLTTVRQPMRQFGILAVQQLLRRINDPSTSPETIVLPSQFIIRHSCGC